MFFLEFSKVKFTNMSTCETIVLSWVLVFDIYSYKDFIQRQKIKIIAYTDTENRQLSIKYICTGNDTT